MLVEYCIILAYVPKLIDSCSWSFCISFDCCYQDICHRLIFTFIFDIGSSEESDTNDLELLTRDKRDFDENQQNFRNKRLTTRRVGDVDVVVQGDLSYELI